MGYRLNYKFLLNQRIRIQHIVMVFALACMSLCQATLVRAENNSSKSPKILVLGDSLSAEYGLARGTGWVALLEKKLQAEKLSWQIINASISGETTAGGQARLAQLLKVHQPQIVIIELGANDALRGLQLPATEKNLRAMVQSSKKSGAQVLLLGMRIPPNYGQQYTQKFFELFGHVASSEEVSHLPFFLEKVAQKIELFQADRIHPNEKAQSILLDNVWSRLFPLLR